MMRPGGSARPRDTGAPLPVTPDMLAALAQAIAGGVKYVQYADRRVDFMSFDDLRRAYDWVLGQLGVGQNVPVRRGASFSKGLAAPYYYSQAGVEHSEIADALWSRQVPRAPGQTSDVDWEQR
jgi:hypothetical protein